MPCQATELMQRKKTMAIYVAHWGKNYGFQVWFLSMQLLASRLHCTQRGLPHSCRTQTRAGNFGRLLMQSFSNELAVSLRRNVKWQWYLRSACRETNPFVLLCFLFSTNIHFISEQQTVVQSNLEKYERIHQFCWQFFFLSTFLSLFSNVRLFKNKWPDSWSPRFH